MYFFSSTPHINHSKATQNSETCTRAGSSTGKEQQVLRAGESENWRLSVPIETQLSREYGFGYVLI